jgi:hypothetical protein
MPGSFDEMLGKTCTIQIEPETLIAGDLDVFRGAVEFHQRSPLPGFWEVIV